MHKFISLCVLAPTTALLWMAGCGPSSPPAPAEKASGESAEEKQAAAKEEQPSEPATIPAPSDVAAPPADAERTASGLASKVLKPGTGRRYSDLVLLGKILQKRYRQSLQRNGRMKAKLRTLSSKFRR